MQFSAARCHWWRGGQLSLGLITSALHPPSPPPLTSAFQPIKTNQSNLGFLSHKFSSWIIIIIFDQPPRQKREQLVLQNLKCIVMAFVSLFRFMWQMWRQLQEQRRVKKYNRADISMHSSFEKL